MRRVVVGGSDALLWKRVDAGVIDGSVNGIGRDGRAARPRRCGRSRPASSATTRSSSSRGRSRSSPTSSGHDHRERATSSACSSSCPWRGPSSWRSPRRESESLQKALGLAVSGATFVLSLLLVTGFQDVATLQFVEQRPWIPAWGISYHVGVDGLSLWLVILTTFLTPLCLLGSWSSIEKRVREFVVFMLLLEAGMIGVFVALDLFLFYVFWEAMLIPMYFLIGIWGHERRIYAAVKFFLYTFAGSVLMLVAFLVLYKNAGLGHLRHPDARGGAGRPRARRPGSSWPAPSPSRSRCRCGRSTPGCPTRTSRRPTAGSVILAGVLLKMGGYGFLRLAIPLFPDAAMRFAPLVGVLAVDRHRLRRARLAGAARPQEARRLLVGLPPRLRDAGHRRLHDHRRRRLGLPDAQPRHLDGGALLPGRHALRPAAHPADRGVRRAEGGHALVLRRRSC